MECRILLISLVIKIKEISVTIAFEKVGKRWPIHKPEGKILIWEKVTFIKSQCKLSYARFYS